MMEDAIKEKHMYLISNNYTGRCLCDDNLHILTFDNVPEAFMYLRKNGVLMQNTNRGKCFGRKEHEQLLDRGYEIVRYTGDIW